jgi:hypothetical protein
VPFDLFSDMVFLCDVTDESVLEFSFNFHVYFSNSSCN